MLCFTGENRFTVDSKRRINIPAAALMELFKQTGTFQQSGEEEVFKDSEAFKKYKDSGIPFHITIGPDDCLFVYPQSVFKKMAAKISARYGSRAADNEEERRFFLETMANAPVARCDQQGRITVPQKHLDHAKIADEVLVIGAFDHLEFWNPDEFEAFINKSSKTPKERVKLFSSVERDLNDE